MTSLRIDAVKLIAARHSRAMSQEEVALACGLSVRTVQRIETSGTASLESTKALTALFGDIRLPEAAEHPEGERRRQTWAGLARERRIGAAATAIGGALSAVGILTGYLSGHASSANAGAELGILGALMGGTFALVRWLDRNSYR